VSEQRREVQADRPAFLPGGHGSRLFMGQADVRLRKDLLGANHVEGQVASQKLDRITRRPQRGQVMLLGTTRRDQLRAPRNPGNHHTQHIVTGR
jgi:hypothetical protein